MTVTGKIVVPLLVLATAISACGDDSLESGGSSTKAPGATPTEPTSTAAPATSTPVTSPATTNPATTSPASTSPASTQPTTIPTTEPTSPTTEPADVTTTEPQQPPEVTTAIADLAATLAVDPTEIELIQYEQVTWANGALGCPQPDRAYTQALVDGFRIELSVEGATYWYHGGRSGVPFLCENPVPPASGGRSDT